MITVAFLIGLLIGIFSGLAIMACIMILRENEKDLNQLESKIKEKEDHLTDLINAINYKKEEPDA